MKNLANDSSKRESYNGYGEFQDDKLKTFCGGKFKDGKLHGYGEESSIYEATYMEGHFENGILDGWGCTGVWTHREGGHFSMGKLNGMGEIDTRYASHDYYCSGEFKFGKLNGSGRVEWTLLGDYYRIKYFGEFKDNKFEGIGKLILPSLALYYKKESQKEGAKQIELIFPKDEFYGKLRSKINTYSKIESWKWDSNFEESPDGPDIYYKEDLEDQKYKFIKLNRLEIDIYYKGEFKEGKFDGFGELLLPTGEIYRGDFKDGMQHGMGIVKFKDGTVLAVEFEYGQAVKNLATLSNKFSVKAAQMCKSSNILFIDTETTGLPTDFDAPASDTNKWPRLVQLAYLLYDENQKLITKGNFIIKPEGYSIPIESTNIHGIFDSFARENGVLIETALNKFSALVDCADSIVAHNISYDLKVIESEYYRKGSPLNLLKKQKICTMTSTIDFCSLPGNYGFKYPKLSELYEILFNISFENAHNAEFDVNATAKCFWELKKRQII